MGKVFLISDTHFGHANIIKYCKRPFSSVDEMDEYMVQKWNNVVRPDDVVWHLGDVYFGEKGWKSAKRLNGKKFLVLGNHDKLHEGGLEGLFHRIVVGKALEFSDFVFWMSHYPVHESQLFNNAINLHGHIHNNSINDSRYVNLSVEAIDYTPVSLESLFDRFRSTTP